MHELVRVQLIHVGDVLGDRIVIDGEDVRVTASSAQTIGMAVHELATNALKYGALSNDRGEVRIGWSAAREKGGKEMLQMLWAEEGGPAVEAPATTGFGSVVTKDMLQYSLGAEVEVDFRRTGLVWQMRCPLDRTGARGGDGPAMAGQGERTPVARSPAPALRPARPKVLVVEDETLLAYEIAGLLGDAGFDVIGPATTLADAVKILQEDQYDAAVLDVHLGCDTSEPVATGLIARAVSVIAITSYSRAQLPPVFEEARVLSKPVRLETLLAELRECLGARPGA